MQPKRTRTIPRGIRNNNPLNIRIGNVWLGERANPDDPAFEQFVHMKYGLRAGFVLLRRYIRHYKRNTISSIISAWAPANENDVQRYINVVSSMTGILPDTQLTYEDKEAIVSLVDAMVYHENGQHVDNNLISAAYDIT